MNESTSTQEPAAVAAPGAAAALKAAKPTTKPTGKKKAPTARKRAQAPKPASKAGRRAPRADSKKATVLAMLQRKGGATIAEIRKATDWQDHSIRGFISRTIGKRMGLKVHSTRDAEGNRRYRSTER